MSSSARPSTTLMPQGIRNDTGTCQPGTSTGERYEICGPPQRKIVDNIP